MIRLSSFYGLWDGQAADNKYNEKHLFFDPKYKGNVYGQHEVVTKTLSRIAPSIFHYCLKFIVDEYGLTSPLLPKLLSKSMRYASRCKKFKYKYQ